MNPTKEFRDYMISQGAALVGIGDLTAVPSTDYPVGIAVAVLYLTKRLPPEPGLAGLGKTTCW